MVLSYDEEINLQQKKFEIKDVLLQKQHNCNMRELEMQLRIEAVKVYNNVVDPQIKEEMKKIIFDYEGREK